MSPIPKLQVEDLVVAYGDIRVLWKISFEVEEGQIVSLIGSNGAGKTTTLKTIAGLLRASSGRIKFGSRLLSESDTQEIVEAGVIYVPEGRGIFPDMSVEENLLMGSYSKRARAHYGEFLSEVFTLFPILRERRKQAGGTLSGGEAQMLAIGRGMMGMPSLLMLDEPSAGISPKIANSIFNAIERLKAQGLTVLIVEQDAGRALGLSDAAFVLENGRITFKGKGAELLENDHVKEAYLGL